MYPKPLACQRLHLFAMVKNAQRTLTALPKQLCRSSSQSANVRNAVALNFSGASN
jgi:hypothetical protein